MLAVSGSECRPYLCKTCVTVNSNQKRSNALSNGNLVVHLLDRVGDVGVIKQSMVPLGCQRYRRWDRPAGQSGGSLDTSL